MFPILPYLPLQQHFGRLRGTPAPHLGRATHKWAKLSIPISFPSTTTSLRNRRFLGSAPPPISSTPPQDHADSHCPPPQDHADSMTTLLFLPLPSINNQSRFSAIIATALAPDGREPGGGRGYPGRLTQLCSMTRCSARYCMGAVSSHRAMPIQSILFQTTSSEMD
jgi:hypothetical protein